MDSFSFSFVKIPRNEKKKKKKKRCGGTIEEDGGGNGGGGGGGEQKSLGCCVYSFSVMLAVVQAVFEGDYVLVLVSVAVVYSGSLGLYLVFCTYAGSVCSLIRILIAVLYFVFTFR